MTEPPATAQPSSADARTQPENDTVTVVHNDRGDRWDQAPATVTQRNAEAHRQVAESRLQLGDLAEYDARTVDFPDGPKSAPGGRGRVRDVWASQGQAVARVELEGGTFDVPPLEDLRPVRTVSDLARSPNEPQAETAVRLATHEDAAPQPTPSPAPRTAAPAAQPSETAERAAQHCPDSPTSSEELR